MSKEATARSAISAERAMKLAQNMERLKPFVGGLGNAILRELTQAAFALSSEAKEQPDNTCNNALRIQGKAYPRTCKKCGLGPCVELAQQALDKKAENARELGLDYEPAQQEPNKDGSPCPEFWDWLPKAYNFDDNGSFTKYNMEVAFLAGKQASQPAQQEPVAYWIPKAEQFCIASPSGRPFAKAWEPLYTSPRPSQPQQKPVGTYGEIFESMRALLQSGRQADQQIYIAMQDKPLYASPPTLSLAQRQARSADTWVGLTDEEITDIWAESSPYYHEDDFARAIEAKLRSKNEDRN